MKIKVLVSKFVCSKMDAEPEFFFFDKEKCLLSPNDMTACHNKWLYAAISNIDQTIVLVA